MTLLFQVGSYPYLFLSIYLVRNGSDFTFYPKPVASDGKVIVDWGDGTKKEYTVGMWNKKVNGNYKL
jgi:hypothetical protein